VFEHVSHRQRQIGLAVKGPRDERDSAPGDQLAHKHNTTAPFIPALTPDIEAKIHFLKITVERNGQPYDACVEKQETDNAEVRLTLVKIEFGVAGNKRLKNLRIDGEIQHRQVTPVRREKRFSHQGAAAYKPPANKYGSL
jgi:hypothetical protein